jgi:hypothetical protein
MGFVYTATASGTPGLQTTCPAETDPRNAASVNVALQGIADDVSRVARGGRVAATLARSFAHFEYTPGALDAWVRYRSTTSTYTSHWSQSSTTEDTVGAACARACTVQPAAFSRSSASLAACLTSGATRP